MNDRVIDSLLPENQCIPVLGLFERDMGNTGAYVVGIKMYFLLRITDLKGPPDTKPTKSELALASIDSEGKPLHTTSSWTLHYQYINIRIYGVVYIVNSALHSKNLWS